MPVVWSRVGPDPYEPPYPILINELNCKIISIIFTYTKKRKQRTRSQLPIHSLTSLVAPCTQAVLKVTACVTSAVFLVAAVSAIINEIAHATIWNARLALAREIATRAARSGLRELTVDQLDVIDSQIIVRLVVETIRVEADRKRLGDAA
jgi:hypothetical protein